MIHAYTFPTPRHAHDTMCEQLVWGTVPDIHYDWTHGTEVGLHNVAIHCGSFDWSFDLKSLWIPKTRWTMMARQYIDPTLLDQCLDMIEDRMSGARRGKQARGIAILRTGEHDPTHMEDDGISTVKTRLVQGKGTGRGVRRRWGSCMLALSFRATPTPTITLHSRTTYFGYLAAMDISVAHAFARECSAVTGIAVEDMEFVWILELAQFHGFRSLAWMLGNEEIRHGMDEDVDGRKGMSARMAPGNQPGYRKALDGYSRILASDRAGKLYGDEAFSSFARVRRRFHMEVMGAEYAAQFEGGTKNNGGKGSFPILPSVMSNTLDFTVLSASTPIEDDDDED